MNIQKVTTRMETTIRDLVDPEGRVLIRQAVFERNITETLVGWDGKIATKSSLIVKQPIIEVAVSSQSFTATPYLNIETMEVYYVMKRMPITAHFKTATLEENALGYRISTDLSSPLATMTAEHDDYMFVLHLAMLRQIHSTLFVITNQTFSPTFLPNTWSDGRVCLGSAMDNTIAKANGQIDQIPALFTHWARSQYNNHLVDDDIRLNRLSLGWTWSVHKGKSPTWTPHYDAFVWNGLTRNPTLREIALNAWTK